MQHPLARLLPDLLTRHSGFRRLWLSQLISNFGDWFGVLAAYALILKNDGSELMLGMFIITKMLSFAAFSPFGGYLADRFNRRTVMIVTDLGRAAVVLLFLLADQPDMLWILYAGTALQMAMAAVFEPARSGLTPDMLKREDISGANVISSATWSVVFAVGMGIGGLATELFGVAFVFVFDALTYLVSAWFIFRIPDPGVQRAGEVTSNAWQGMRDGFRYVATHAEIRFPVLVKGTTSLFLGGLVYALVLVGDEKLGMGAAGIGFLYMSRGVGTAFGPVWARRLFPDRAGWLSAFGLFMVAGGVFYVLCGVSGSLILLLAAVFFAHAASAAAWVLSTVLVQETAQPQFRGRVSGLEWLGFTVSNSMSTLVASFLLDRKIVQLDPLIWIFGGGLSVLGLAWMYLMERHGAHGWWKPRGAAIPQ